MIRIIAILFTTLFVFCMGPVLNSPPLIFESNPPGNNFSIVPIEPIFSVNAGTYSYNCTYQNEYQNRQENIVGSSQVQLEFLRPLSVGFILPMELFFKEQSPFGFLRYNYFYQGNSWNPN